MSDFGNNSFSERPLITSYDAGYEHSVERLLATRQLLQDADAELSHLKFPAQASAKKAGA